MTRSSWHHFWMLSTWFSIVVCLLFITAAVGISNQVGVQTVSGVPAQMQGDFPNLACDLAVLAVVFWGFVAVLSGMAWAACTMAFNERRNVKIWGNHTLLEVEKGLEKKEFDASLRD